MSPADRIARPLKGLIVGQVRALFNDAARGERPVQRRDDALFPPDSVAWRVHGDVTSMLVGGIAALLLQMLHPKVLAGVWDHSGFRDDMQGRLRRTARFIAVTTFGPPDDARALLARVRAIHDAVGGTLPDGTPYRAGDPALLAWVHVCEVLSFLDGWIRYGEPGMSRIDQDRYVAEMARIAEPLGVSPVPRTRAEAEAIMAAMRPDLLVDARTRDVATVLLDQPAPSLAAGPFQAITMQAAIDLLPAWARTLHGLSQPRLGRPLLRAGTYGRRQHLALGIPRMNAETNPAIPAATLILFRERGSVPELLFVERSKAMVFAGGALVFPGGRVDPGDRALALEHGGKPDGPDLDDLAARIAAIRETVEEVGVPVGVSATSADALVALRAALHGGATIGAALRDLGLTLDPAALVAFARWLPAHAHMRVFDTRFYLARLPDDAPEPLVDDTENVRVFWSTARAVLDDADVGRVRVIFPTRRNLERLAQFASFDAAVVDAKAHEVRAVTPWIETRDGREHLCIPDDLGYPVTSEPLASAMRG